MCSYIDETEIPIEYDDKRNDSDPLRIYSYSDIMYQYNTDKTKETSSRFENSNIIFLCKFCKLVYSTQQTLSYHVKTKHPEKANLLKKQNLKKKRQKRYQCHICKCFLQSITDLNSHMNSFHPMDFRTLYCVCCTAFFSNQYEIEQHLCIEHGIRSHIFKCNVCGYWTIKKSHYKQHLKIHNSKKDNECRYCDYSTSSISNFNNHQQIHSNYRPFACEFKNCNYRASTKSALRIHKFKHYPEKHMLYCDQCNYKTVYKQSLSKHLDSHRRKSII